MPNARLVFFIISLIFVGIVSFFIIKYAQGFGFDIGRLKFTPTGILVATSTPDGAQIFINGSLKSATNQSINLIPDVYDIQIIKEGFSAWTKRLTIEAGVVAKTDALLFPKAPTLTPLTFFGATKPVLSPDGTKLAWVIPTSLDNQEKTGIWVLELGNLPFGFSKDARQVTDAEVGNDLLWWSPDSRNLVLEKNAGTFLIDPGTLTSQGKLVNVSGKKLQEFKVSWEKYEEKRKLSQLVKPPDEVKDILERKTNYFLFAPDETKILYTATASAAIKDNLIPSLPGNSTQKQERNIKQSQTYVYDIKEDRNFLIEGDSDRKLAWFPTSRHLLLAEPNGIAIIEYDGTNRTLIWSGPYIAPFAFVTPNANELIILTNFGATNGELPNLYTIKLK